MDDKLIEACAIAACNAAWADVGEGWVNAGDEQEREFRTIARAVIPIARNHYAEVFAKVAISAREKAIAARNFLAISEPGHADRHLRDLIAICEAAAPDAIAEHDAAIRKAGEDQ